MLDLQNAHHLSLTMQVELKLKQALISARLAPGERLNTRDIADNMHISITPVREALLRLVAEGALCVAPAQAFTVPCITRAQFDEIALIRHQLEPLALAHFLRQPRDDVAQVLMQLSRLNEEFNHAWQQRDVGQTLKLQRHFRFTLYKASALPLLYTMIEQLWIRTGPCFHFLHTTPVLLKGHQHGYDDLLKALDRNDAAMAAQELAKALSQSTELAMRHHFDMSEE